MLLLADPPFTNREQITPRPRDEHDHDGNPIMGEITTTCAGERTSRPGAPFPTPGRFLWSCALPLIEWRNAAAPFTRAARGALQRSLNRSLHVVLTGCGSADTRSPPYFGVV